MIDQSNGRLLHELQFFNPTLGVVVIEAQSKNEFYDMELPVYKLHTLKVPFSYVGGLIHSVSLFRQLKDIVRAYDLCVIQLPFVGFLPLLLIRKPTIYHLCANVLTASSNPVKYKGMHAILAKSFAIMMDKSFKILFKRPKTKLICNGLELGQLYSKFKPIVTVSSSIYKNEIINFEQVSTRTSNLSFIFVGRPSLEKGFDTLMSALADLRIPFHLFVVGFTQQEFKILLPHAYGLTRHFQSKITYCGHMGWDNGLKEILRQVHIGIVPSRSEGTPRVIIEFMSQGVAVIASRIGGIPGVIVSGLNGILVEPGNAMQLADTISQLSLGTEFRNEIVLKGLQTAHQHTVNEFANVFKEAIEQLTNE
ncbi:MAG: glycosyltransferase family 4 protein [Cyclobacteriaceae bacterium]|nr:glycosyltransferase family 4 protein [Cyclobacteriaceae bacterium]